jgi:protein-tyrosine phosphatase
LPEPTPARTRHLDWDGCLNLRDLGGLTTEDGRTTAWGQFVRGDTLCGLSDAGRGAALGYGIRTVVDLRSVEEITAEPNPFAALPDVVSYIHHPFNDPATEATISEQPSATQRYLTMVDEGGTRIARVFTAFASSGPAVLFHCYAGRDRTGIVAALLLRLARVDVDTIVRDYEMTDERLRPRYEQWLTELEGTRRERFVTALTDRGAPLRAVVDRVEDRYGSVGSFLEEHGVARSDVSRVRERISGGAASA